MIDQKIKFYYYIRDNGDGSASIEIYRTEGEAQAAADEDFNLFGQSFCDNVGYKVLDLKDEWGCD